ncbi:MAG: BamA/TamA family outer membrane protein [Bacteroidetes bacterium]|nr:BamA/TamA family outer membrane protein [Bacteroidota bacterium]
MSWLAQAQLLQPDTSKRVNFLVIPVIFTGPETNWAFGASASMAFKTTHKNDSLTRTSIIQALGIYTLNKQYIGGLDATIYFPKERFILYSNVSYSYFPDKFWGVGPYTKPADIERYSTSQLGFSAHLKHKVWKRLFIGALCDVKHVYDFRYWEHGNIDTNAIPGKQPYNLVGGGLSISYDTRNSSFYPTRGYFIQTQCINYGSYFGSDYNMVKWMAEARYFKQIHTNIISATQLFSVVNNGTVPLKSLAMLGGSDNLRGFYQGRFRDQVYISLVSELRFPVNEMIGFTLFGGAGNVSHSLNSWRTDQLKYSYGAGIRLAIRPKDRLNLRIDYGYSDKNNKGLYFTIGEAF